MSEMKQVERFDFHADHTLTRECSIETGDYVRFEDYERLREYVHSVWRTLGLDIAHGEGFNKQLFHDQAGALLVEKREPKKYA